MTTVHQSKLRKRHLVTGGSGFIGSHIVDALIASGDFVTVLDNFSTGLETNLNYAKKIATTDQLDIISGDICDQDLIGEILSADGKEGCSPGYDHVFHHAAIVSVPWSVDYPDETTRINEIATRDLIDIAKTTGVCSMVFASSSAVYGESSICPISEKALTLPTSPYAQTKLAAEQYGLSKRDDKFAFTALRYFNVYGTRQRPDSAYAAVIPAFVAASRQHLLPTIYGDGSQTRDFCHVSDVVGANLLAAGLSNNHNFESRINSTGGVYNIGSGLETSINDLFCIIFSEALTTVGLDGDRSNSQPTKIQPCYAPERPGDIHRSCADISAARTHLIFSPQMTLSVGIQELLVE